MTATFILRVNNAIQYLQKGKMVILTDHPDRENEGDLIFPAEKITADVINFMMRYCSGIICLPMTAEKMRSLELPLMIPRDKNGSSHGTPFTISIEAREGVTTGVSAQDRATTILAAAKANAKPSDLVKPGHVFPLQATDGGVLARTGHTEGSTDLMRLAGFSPSAVLCEVMNADGTVAKGTQLETFAAEHDIAILSIEDLIDYRLATENRIDEEVQTDLPIADYGTFKMSVIKEMHTGQEHVILSNEKAGSAKPTLVRVHSSCFTGDLFDSKRCDCHAQLHYSLKQISEEGGILIYLTQEGRGIGLFNKIKAYSLQEQGLDTVEANLKLGLPADSRNYSIAANILRNKGIKQIRLLTNNPEKLSDLKKYGIASVEREPMPVFCNAHNKSYLQTKKDRLNHIMNDEL